MKRVFCTSIIIVIYFAFSLLTIKAQDNRLLYFMSYNPYSSFTNPGNVNHSKLYVGVPLFSNFNVSLFNSAIHYKKLFEKNETGTTITVDKFIRSLKPTNALNLSLNIELLGFGFGVDKFFISPSYRIRLEEYFVYPDVLLTLPIKGNMTYLDSPAEIKKLRLNATLCHELSVGIQYQVNDNLSIGMRPKLLMGLANINTVNSYFKLTTTPETYDIRIEEEFKINSALFLDFESPDILKILPNIFKNRGFAIDLGATYQFNQSFGMSLSVIDAGFIKWQTNPMNISSKIADGGQYYQDGGFCFSGLNFDRLNSDSLGGGSSGVSELATEFIDSLKLYFPITQTTNKYTTATYTKLYLSGYYNINRHNALHLMYRGDIVGKSLFSSFTFAYSGNFFDMLDVYASTSIINKSFLFVGLGLGLRLGPIQLYAVTDNILAAISPLNSSVINLQMGMLVNIPKNKREKFERTPKVERKEKKEKTNKSQKNNESDEIEL